MKIPNFNLILTIIFFGIIIILFGLFFEKINDFSLTLINLEDELVVSNATIDFQSYELESITATYLNSSRILEDSFVSYVHKLIDNDFEVSKHVLLFINSDKDCNMCIDKEMFFLDSIVNNFDGEIIVLRNLIDLDDFKFFIKNYPSIKKMYPLNNEIYSSFFLDQNTFPFYALISRKQRGASFFVPNADFPYLTKRFLKIKLAQ